MGIVSWIVLGLIAGFIASKILNRTDRAARPHHIRRASLDGGTLIHKATLTTSAPAPGGDAKMAVKYEDNFGFWEIDCPEEVAFFEHVQSQSVRAICRRCSRMVRLMSTKTICAPCASALECGAPTAISKYRHTGPKTASGP
jgi:hypothetical protein